MRRRALALVVLAAVAAALPAGLARADGDPGSDVLVYQPLFVASDAGVPIAQQGRIGELLQSAHHAGFPIRVAIIATRQDLGAITGLWLQPRNYARFLGLELSLAYKGRLLVVMPNGFGFNWPGHSADQPYGMLGRITIASGGAGLASAAQAAVSSLAAADGVKLGLPNATSSAAPPGSTSTTRSAPKSSTDVTVAIVAVALIAAAALLVLARRWRGRIRLRLPGRPSLPIALSGVAGLAAAAIIVLVVGGSPGTNQRQALAGNPNLDPGTPLSRPAPDFTLTDQFGQPVSLRSYRGKVVLLAFNDSECTTICPLTTTAMLDAQAMLGRAASQVQLLGIDANPAATSLEDVQSYSQLHGMLHAWHFLTGSLAQLRRVWKAYSIDVEISQRQIDHTPALFVVDQRGRLARLYITQQSYAAVGQLGQLLAQEASRLLPSHPAVNTRVSYAQINGTTPATSVSLPGGDGGRVAVGPGRPRLYLFFATWDQQITALAGGLEGLSRYSTLARRAGLPELEAIDEGSVEPAGALQRFMAGLRGPLPYPVGVDRDGRLADGYEVQGLPWLMVTSASGRIAWYYSVAAGGWPTTARLIAYIREALARAAGAPATLGAALAGLKGSPTALAALHQQAARLLGGEPALAARVRALRGYPLVINAWASWCPPCQAEFGLFAAVSARYGRQVAFLGADTNDSAGDAAAFLLQHPVSYPSYQDRTANITGIAPGGLEGLPDTIFINRAGKVVYVKSGQYDALGTLEGDIQNYALGQ